MLKSLPKTLVAVAAAATLSLGLASCASGSTETTETSASSTPVDGGNIRIGLDREVSSLDPAAGSIVSQTTMVVAYTMYDALFTYGDSGEIVPQLAESAMPSDDLKTWTITIHPDVTFSNGDPLDSQAVINHIKRLQDPASKCACAFDASEIGAMAAVDSTTVEFTLNTPNSGFLSMLTRNLGFIASDTAKDANGNPLGSGPYVLDEFAKGTSVSFAKRDDYWGEAGHADKVTFMFLPDTDSRYQSLVTDAVDLIWTETPSQYTQAGADGLLAFSANSATSTGVFNTQKPPFDNVKARQAVQAAIDRDALLNVVNSGLGSISNGPIGSQSQYDQVEYPAFDKDKAKKLVAEVGDPISFTYTLDNRPQSQQRATAIQQMLKDVGITMDIKPLDISAWGQALMKKDFDMLDMTTSLYGDTDGALYTFTSTSPSNFSGLVNTEVDTDVTEARATGPVSERGELYGKAAQVIVDEAAIAFYTENPAGFIGSTAIKGIPDLSKRNIITVRPGQFWLDK